MIYLLYHISLFRINNELSKYESMNSLLLLFFIFSFYHDPKVEKFPTILDIRNIINKIIIIRTLIIFFFLHLNFFPRE